MPVVILSSPNAHLALTKCGRLGPAVFTTKLLDRHVFGSARRTFNRNRVVMTLPEGAATAAPT